jgi:hypothetical protein
MEFLESFKPITKKEYSQKVEEEKNLLHLINHITYLRKEDLNNPPIEYYQNIFRSLNANNYYTYMFYLQALEKKENADLEEINYYKKIIKNLIKEEQNELKKNIVNN